MEKENLNQKIMKQSEESQVIPSDNNKLDQAPQKKLKMKRFLDILAYYGPLITFIQLVMAIIAIIAGLNLSSNRTIDTFITNTNDSLMTEIETLKKDINDEVDQIEKRVLVKELSDINNTDSIKINSFKQSILDLVTYQGVHDNSEFLGANLNESCDLAKANITERINYDNFLKILLGRMNGIFEISHIKNESMFTTLEIATLSLTERANEWLVTDSIRNRLVINKLETIKNDEDTIIYNQALTPIMEFKKNPENYRFQKTLYGHLLSINRMLKQS